MGVNIAVRGKLLSGRIAGQVIRGVEDAALNAVRVPSIRWIGKPNRRYRPWPPRPGCRRTCADQLKLGADKVGEGLVSSNFCSGATCAIQRNQLVGDIGDKAQITVATYSCIVQIRVSICVDIKPSA